MEAIRDSRWPRSRKSARKISKQRLGAGKVQVLDVRREPEWDAGHVEGATWWPLDNFRVSPPEIDHEVPLAVHCKGGYRSMIAASSAAARWLPQCDQSDWRI